MNRALVFPVFAGRRPEQPLVLAAELGGTFKSNGKSHGGDILRTRDKLFWVAVRRFWSGWQQSFIAVTPETVVH
jgi:hypothetical protein